MGIGVQSYKRVDVLTVEGRIDSSNANELDEAFKQLTDRGRYMLAVDLSGVSYMSSAGLRAIVSAYRTCNSKGGDVRLIKPSERVAEVLDLAGLAPVLKVYDDDTAAVGSY